MRRSLGKVSQRLSRLLPWRSAEHRDDDRRVASVEHSSNAARARPPLDAPSAPVRLVIADVDGTLVDSRGELPRAVQQACRRMMADGVGLVLATARSPRGVYRTQRELSGASITIACNGAVIWERHSRRALHHQPLDVPLAGEIVALAREIEPDMMVGVERLDAWHTDRWERQIVSVLPDLTPPDSVRPLDELLAEPVSRLNLIATPQQMIAVRSAISRAFWQTRRVSVFPGDHHLMQLTHPFVDKAIAAQRLARRLGIDRESVMVIGDGMNDLGLFGWAGFSVAVANGCRAAREAADVVVGSNDDYGAAEAIERYVLESNRAGRSEAAASDDRAGAADDLSLSSDGTSGDCGGFGV